MGEAHPWGQIDSMTKARRGKASSHKTGCRKGGNPRHVFWRVHLVHLGMREVASRLWSPVPLGGGLELRANRLVRRWYGAETRQGPQLLLRTLFL